MHLPRHFCADRDQKWSVRSCVAKEDRSFSSDRNTAPRILQMLIKIPGSIRKIHISNGLRMSISGASGSARPCFGAGSAANGIRCAGIGQACDLLPRGSVFSVDSRNDFSSARVAATGFSAPERNHLPDPRGGSGDRRGAFSASRDRRSDPVRHGATAPAEPSRPNGNRSVIGGVSRARASARDSAPPRPRRPCRDCRGGRSAPLGRGCRSRTPGVRAGRCR